MPTYAYRCSDCGHEFDQFQRFSDDPLTECPACQGRVRRVLHPVGVVFKGSGWYVTDSRKPAPSENGGSDKGESVDKKGEAFASPTKSEKSEPAKAKAAAAADD
jgi:putative FmdB family regulatory protein